MLIFVLTILLTINATTPNATIPNEADGSTDNNNKYIDTVPSKESIKELKKVCETSDGDWINGECTFVTQKGDDRYNDATADKEAFEHNMADKDLLNVYREQQEETDQEVEQRGEEITENDDGSFSTTLRQEEKEEEDIAQYNIDADKEHDAAEAEEADSSESNQEESSSGKDEDNDGREDSNGEEWENNDYKDDEGDDD